MRCAACGKHEERMLISNFLQIWQEQHEWTDFPRKGHVCNLCIQWLQSQDFKDHLYNDPLPEVTGPEQKWDNVSAIGIGIFDGELLGLRCAKIKYGVDAVREIMQGFRYEDERGRHIIRVTTDDEPETERCSKCWLQLCECNAWEVTV